MYTSIVTPKDLITALEELSKALVKNSLPLHISYSNVVSTTNG